MLCLVISLSALGPVLLSCVVVLVSLWLQNGAASVGAIVCAGALLLVAPLVATGSASILYRWCFGSATTTCITAAAGISAILVSLSDRLLIQGMVGSFEGRAPDVALITRIVVDASVVGCFSTAVVMGAVLLIELPARWFLNAPESRDLNGVLSMLRWIATLGIIITGWSILSESAWDRISAIYREVVS